MSKLGFTFVLIVLGLSGCRGPRILRDGFSLGPSDWQKSEGELKTRAAFDLNCPAEELTLQVLAERYDGYATQVGVKGCGNRVV